MNIFEYTFFNNALIGLMLISIASAIIGTYIVARRLMFVTGGITHACFGGLGLGYYMGINPMITAGIFAVGSATGIEWLSTKGKVREDSAISVFWALGMAIGVIFIFLTPGYVPELTSFLFGNILTISQTDLIIFAVYLAALLIFALIYYRPIIACAFDKDFARTIGMPVKTINFIMMIFTAICIVLTLKLIGIMLLMSLFSIPQMIAETFTPRIHRISIIASSVSLVCSVAGLFISYYSEIPASATIVLTLILAYAIAKGLKKVCKIQA